MAFNMGPITKHTFGIGNSSGHSSFEKKGSKSLNWIKEQGRGRVTQDLQLMIRLIPSSHP